MFLQDAALAEASGKLWLHHLASTYRVEVNEATVAAIEAALAGTERATPAGRALVDRLAQHGMVRTGAFRPIERRPGELISLELEPIGSCNLRCRHCFVDFSGDVMTEATFARTLDGARSLGAIELTFNGGEPLLHPRCLGWIEAARAAGFRVLLFTNATRVDPAIACRLAASGLARATVSLDGFEEDHDRLRGAKAFARTVAGIRALVSAGVSVFTTTLVHPDNERSVDALQRFAREELGASGTRTSTIAPLGRAATQPRLLLPPQRLREVYAGQASGATGHSSGLLPCRAGVDKLYVSAAGAVYACHLFERPDAVLGHVAQQSLAEIHRDVLKTRTGPLLRGFAPSDLKACSTCPALAECRGGCRARAWTLTGDRFGPDPVECQKRGWAPASERPTVRG